MVAPKITLNTLFSVKDTDSQGGMLPSAEVQSAVVSMNCSVLFWERVRYSPGRWLGVAVSLILCKSKDSLAKETCKMKLRVHFRLLLWD